MSSVNNDPFLADSKPSPMKKFRSSALVVMSTVKDKAGFSDGYKSYESTSTSLRNSLLAILAYVFIGTVTFSVWMEDWTLIDAMYFTSVTFTTVGYGDLYPVTGPQRFWGTIFVLLGIIVLGGIAMGIIFDRLINMYDTISKDVKSGTYQHYLNLFDDDGSMLNTEQTRIVRESAQVTLRILPLLIILFLPSLLIGYLEGWTFLQSLYFFAITATTVGYGDISPQNQFSRVIATLYLPFCVAIMAWILGEFSGIYIKNRAEKLENEFLNRELTNKDLHEMDTDDNRSVSYGEFLAFMLEVMGKVEKEDMEQIKNLYTRLDADHSGSLTVGDLYRKAYGQTGVMP